jgi:hypothetical protein
MPWPTDPAERERLMRDLGIFGDAVTHGLTAGDPVHIPFETFFGIDPAKADAEQTVWTVISAESTFSTKNDVITLDPSEYRRIK